MSADSIDLTPPSDDKKYAYTITSLNQADVDRIVADHPHVGNRTTTIRSSRNTNGYFVFEIHVHFGWRDNENGEIRLVLPLSPRRIYCGMFTNNTNNAAAGVEIDMSPVAMYLFQMQIPVAVGKSMIRTMLNSAVRQMTMIPPNKFDDPEKMAQLMTPEVVKIQVLSLKQGDEDEGECETRSHNSFFDRVMAFRSNGVWGLKDKYGDRRVDDAPLSLYCPDEDI